MKKNVDRYAEIKIGDSAEILHTITQQDVANVIAFLASDKSNYLTGETIRVNGGKSMI